MHENVMVKLPGERGAQLRAFAEREGLSVTEAIGELLKRAGAADSVPGFACVANKRTPGFLFGFDGFHATMAGEHVAQLADVIEQCVVESGIGGKKIVFDKGGELLIARQRRHSIAIAARQADGTITTKRTLTLDLARDLAAQLRRAVAGA